MSELGNELIDDEMHFPRATIDPNLIKLQSEVTEYVTGVILHQEKKFYEVVNNNFPTMKSDILGTTCKTIIDMITEAINTHYNNIYLGIQYDQSTAEIDLVKEMASHGDYGPHILLDKLIRLTIDAHSDIIREKLCLDNLDLYHKTILEQINVYLLSTNLLHVMSKGPFDDIPFFPVPEGQKPFQIVSNIIFDEKESK